MDTIELGKVVKFLDHLRVPVTESDRSKGRFPYYGANGVQGFVDDFIFDEPLVLLAEDGGHFGSKTRPIAFKVEGKYWVNNHAHVLRPKSDCNIDYLHRVLSYYDVSSYINGATRPKLTKGNAERMPIPFPALPEQKRIAAILDKADRLRRQRRFAQTLSDSFLQSVFIKMFGDPFLNPHEWKPKTLRSVAEKISDGPFGSDLKSEHYQDSGFRVIRLQNIGVGEMIDNDRSYVSREHFDSVLSRHRCVPGDVIIGTMGEPNLRAMILPESIEEAMNKADCVQFRPNKSFVNSAFICWLLNMPGTLTLASGSILGQTRSRISMGRVAELRLPIPPLPLQEKFAAIVQKFERIRRQQREATRQAEHLFQTLLHRAFRDEL